MGKVLYYDKFDWVLFGNTSMVIGMDKIVVAISRNTDRKGAAREQAKL